MKYWILAGDEETNDLDTMLGVDIFGLWPEAALAGLGVADRVFIWSLGPDRGVVGLGEVDVVLQRPIGPPQDVFIRYLTKHFDRPIDRARLDSLGLLAELPPGKREMEIRLLSADSAALLYREICVANPGEAETWTDLLPDPVPATPEDLDLAAGEGKRVWRAHLRRERNRGIVAAKKREVLRMTGFLRCEVCGFDFGERYGAAGAGVCEVHHRLPLHTAVEERQTALADLAIVCANCHRVLHRTDPILSVDELKTRIQPTQPNQNATGRASSSK